MKRTNEQWITQLQTKGDLQEDAIIELSNLVNSGLSFALIKWLPSTNPQFKPLIEEITQDTIIRVLDRIDTFEGRSKFTTWVHKIAVNLALTELRRRKWKDLSLDNLMDEDSDFFSPALMADSTPNPEEFAEQSDMFNRIQKIIAEELTDRQKKAMIAVAIHGIPLEEVARRMDTSRNTLYKLMHDARLRLKKRLAREGLAPEDIFSVFAKK